MVQKRPMVALLTELLLVIRSWFARRARLEAENLILRQHLVVLRRKSPKRVRLWNIDRLVMVWLYRLYPVAPGRNYHHSAGDHNSLAPPRSSRLLALEVPPPRRPSPDCCRDSGADPVVFDPVGGPTLLELIKAMSYLLYLYGALSDQATAVPPLALIAKILTIKGHNIWATSGNPERQKAAVDFVINGLEKGTLKPIIDRVFPFDQIVNAHRYLEAGEQIGKIVVTI
jgi:hypothetical protein